MASGDKTSKYKYARINVSRTLATLAQLIRDPIAKKYEDRQIVLLNDIFIAVPYAFWLYDLPNVTIVVEHLLNGAEDNSNFKSFSIKLLELFVVPPMLCRANEILERRKNLEEYFTFFGFILITTNDMTYKNLVTKALWSILLRKRPVLDRCVSLRVCHEAIENSTLPEMLGNLLEITEGEWYTELLNISIEIAKISNTVCIKMMNEGSLKTVVMKLDPDWRTNTDISTSHDYLELQDFKTIEGALELIELFLKALTENPHDKIKEIAPIGIKSLWSLRYTLRVTVVSSKKLCRNFLMSLILKIMDLYPDELMLQSGIISDITLLAAASEMGTAGTWAAKVNFNTDKEDFEFKKMLLVGVYYCSKYLGADYYIKEKYNILAMLKFITPEYRSAWCSDHLCTLKYYTLIILERLMPSYLDEFMEYNGFMRTTMLIDFYIVCPYDHTILIAALKVIYAALIKKHDLDMMAFCVEMNLCRIIQNLSYEILEEDFNSANQKALHYSFDILTILSESMEYYLFRNVDLVLSVLRRVLEPRDTDIGYELVMMISVLTCLWNLGINNDDFFSHFCESQGVYVLLDVIKDAKFHVKMIGLGLLVDLCEEGSAVPYLVSWRNKGTTLLQMLMKIFREENELIGVQTTHEGIVSDYCYPLMGNLQRLQLEKLVETDSSPAITDMDCSCRPKIYALVQLLDVRFEKEVDIANDYYKIYKYNLTLEDRVTKIFCENYLLLKMGETWLELSMVLKNINFQVVSFDHEMLETMLTSSRNWGLNIYKTQMELKEKQVKNECITETEFYNLLRESKLAEALEALKELQYMARTTEHLFLLAKNMKDNLNLQDLPCTHRTLNTMMGLSWIKNQKITIVSDKSDTDVEVFPLVSPITESVELSIASSNVGSSVSLDFGMNCEGTAKETRQKILKTLKGYEETSNRKCD